MSSLEEKVKKIIAEQLSVSEDQITPEASFVEDLGADSLDTVELVMALEEEFEIDIPDEEDRHVPGRAQLHQVAHQPGLLIQQQAGIPLPKLRSSL